ncbi:MAG: 1,4-dihydroxy-2-naphthoate polyprenyltransferase [Chloroflexia bacterium]
MDNTTTLDTPHAPRPHTPTPTQAWLLAARPKTLPAARRPRHRRLGRRHRRPRLPPRRGHRRFAVALLLQIGANFSNDLFDFRSGADTHERLGPTRVTQSGILSPRAVALGTVVVMTLAAVAGMYLVYRAGWVLLLLGIAAILSALAYTGGPFPLGYNGLGEVFVLIFFGFVAVTGTYYTQARDISGLSLAAAIPVGALVVNILVVNNLRDIDTDRRAGKRTVAVRLGPVGTQLEYILLLAVAYLTLPILWAIGWLNFWWFLPWATSLAWLLVQQIRTRTGRALNATLAGTARLELLFGLLLAISIIL